MSLREKLQEVAVDPHTAELIEKVATKASYGASAGTMYFGFTADEWGIIGIMTGIALGVATFTFNAWFRMKYMRPKTQDKTECK